MSRRARELSIVDELKNSEALLVQEGSRLYHITLENLFNSVHVDPLVGETPVVYSNSTKNGTVATRGEIYATVENLITATYGESLPDHTLYVGVIDTTNNRAYFGTWYIELGTLQCDDFSTVTFTEADATAFSGYIVAPYGEILGTESW